MVVKPQRTLVEVCAIIIAALPAATVGLKAGLTT